MSFLTAEGLRNHVGKHTGERNFKCGICPQSFSFSASASVHRRKHLVNGLYQCERCLFSIKNFGSFKMHVGACIAAMPLRSPSPVALESNFNQALDVPMTINCLGSVPNVKIENGMPLGLDLRPVP